MGMGGVMICVVHFEGGVGRAIQGMGVGTGHEHGWAWGVYRQAWGMNGMV